MQEITYCNKNINSSFAINDATLNFPLQKPMICPYCQAYEDGTRVDSKLFGANGSSLFGIISYRCTHCSKIYLVVYNIDKANHKATAASVHPSILLSYSNERIMQMSPRFIDMYNQALKAESNESIELAAIGYRASLEILIKDYAVTEKHQDKSTVAKKSLCNAIKEYLESPELVASSDVVRILGNDYAHYERKYPEQDFAILKSYMEIFIHLVETKLMIAHPPVSRQPANPIQQASSHPSSKTP